MNELSIALLLFAILPLTVCGQEKPVPTTDDLIAQLGSKSFKFRELAAKQLFDRGPVVLPALRNALTKTHRLEQRLRLEKMIGEMEVAEATTPTLLKLNTQPKPLAEVLDDIQKQTGYQIIVDKNHAQKKVTFSGTERTFQQTFHEIERQTSLTLEKKYPDPALPLFGNKLFLRPKHVQFSGVDGIFRYRLVSLGENRRLDFTASGEQAKPEPGEYNLYLSLEVHAEPRHGIMGIQSAHKVVALNESGKKLYQTSDLLPSLAGPQQAIGFHLKGPPHGEKKLSKLNGKFGLRILTAKKPIPVTTKFLQSKGSKAKIGKRDLEILQTGFDKASACYWVLLNIKQLEDDMSPYLFFEFVNLQDAKGNPYKVIEITQLAGDVDERTLFAKYRMEPIMGPPVRLTVSDWYSFIHDVEFEFRNVPLP